MDSFTLNVEVLEVGDLWDEPTVTVGVRRPGNIPDLEDTEDIEHISFTVTKEQARCAARNLYEQARITIGPEPPIPETLQHLLQDVLRFELGKSTITKHGSAWKVTGLSGIDPVVYNTLSDAFRAAGYPEAAEALKPPGVTKP